MGQFPNITDKGKKELRILRLSEIGAMKPCAATVGFFDGVHRGHCFLIDRLRQLADNKGLSSAIITFDKHPREVMHADFQPKMLSTFEEKTERLAKAGADMCIVLSFSEMRNLSAYEFMRDVLRDKLNASLLLTGYDNRFGHNRSEGFDDYVAYGKRLGIEVMRGEPFVLNGIGVSSSVIRKLLEEGDAEAASMCLGRPYSIHGQVVRGKHIGTDIGFPTANIEPDLPTKLIPGNGVYAARINIIGKNDAIGLESMINIGTRPTFGGKSLTIEAHIFGFGSNIYGERIEAEFIRKIRDERRFSDACELAVQLRKDAKDVIEMLKNKSITYKKK